MNRNLQRAKRLLELQRHLLRLERLTLQAFQEAMTQAQKAESGALSLLNSEAVPVIAPQCALLMAASARAKARAYGSLLQAQMGRTIEQAKQESVAQRNLDKRRIELAKEEARHALETAIEAFLDPRP